MPEDRRLAAIMFTDIVGYTALMGKDEDQAFDILVRNHAIHETLIKKHNCTLIKEIGDGTLASFHTASDAVRCAGEIQNAAKKEGTTQTRPSMLRLFYCKHIYNLFLHYLIIIICIS